MIRRLNDVMVRQARCWVLCDHGHIPERSYALYRAREVLHAIKKWQTRDKSTDKSHRPDHLQTTLNNLRFELKKCPSLNW